MTQNDAAGVPGQGIMVGMGQSRSPDPSARWTFESHGSFLFGHCLVCGFRSPGRRARYSAENDMRAHTLLCESAEALHSEDVGDVAVSPEL